MTAAQPDITGELGTRSHVLPAQEKPHEVLGGRRLDGFAPGPAGVAVHPGQQPPRHPFGVRRAPGV